ncbi:MAG: hypothetical protein GF393_01085 [Armatimonadia bacterium]|nr:hypothetical protein [Armatimonadia bacterium]
MRTGRILIIGLIFLVLANLWVRQGALITLAAQVAMAVPPVPALAALLILLAGLGLLKRLGIRRKEVIGVYAFLTLAVALTSGAAMRFFLPALPVPYYFASEENKWAEFHDNIPGWLVPKGDEVIRQYFEGADNGAVPWDAWAQPLAYWLVFFVGFYGLMMCIGLIFRPVWEEDEHLNYPMSELPLMLAGYRREVLHGLWTSGLFWVGFALICMHNTFNIMQAFNPSITALGLETNLNNIISEHPYTSLQPLVFRYRPLIFGISYLMPGDIVISTLLFYFIYIKGLSFYGAVTGVQDAAFPFYRKQSMGAMVGITLVVIYGARKRIAQVFRRLYENNEVPLWLPIGFILCGAVVLGFWIVAGMDPVTTIAYYGLILSSAIGYMRGRALTGYPHHWIKPLDQERDVMIDFVGSARLAPGGNFRTLTLLSLQHWMSRGYIPQLAAFPLESFKVAREIKVDVKQMVHIMLWAVVLGSIVSWWMHIGAAYDFGANVLEGGTTSGGQRISLMRNSYDSLAGWMRGEQEPDRSHQIAVLVGVGGTVLLALLRRIFIQFPLHPMGFVFAFTGAGENGWGALLMSTLIKSTALRIGGMRMYNRLIPFFLGVIVGHFFAAGTVWSLIASFGGEGFNKYPVWF